MKFSSFFSFCYKCPFLIRESRDLDVERVEALNTGLNQYMMGWQKLFKNIKEIMHKFNHDELIKMSDDQLQNFMQEIVMTLRNPFPSSLYCHALGGRVEVEHHQKDDIDIKEMEGLYEKDSYKIIVILSQKFVDSLMELCHVIFNYYKLYVGINPNIRINPALKTNAYMLEKQMNKLYDAVLAMYSMMEPRLKYVVGHEMAHMYNNIRLWGDYRYLQAWLKYDARTNKILADISDPDKKTVKSYKRYVQDPEERDAFFMGLIKKISPPSTFPTVTDYLNEVAEVLQSFGVEAEVWAHLTYRMRRQLIKRFTQYYINYTKKN